MENILTGLSEQSKVLYSCPEFLILPDMKWDLKTISSLYLLAITQDRTIRSLRDLRKHHVGLLKSIRLEATRVVQTKWALGNGSLRMFIHYQPSYCKCVNICPLSTPLMEILKDHFHVHIVNANYQGRLGMAIGQAHLLDDIIALVSTIDHVIFFTTDSKHSSNWMRLRALGSLSV